MDNIAQKKRLLREQIAKNREYYARLEHQRRLLARDLDYGRRSLERDSLLLERAVISEADYETTAQGYLSKQNSQAGFDASLTSTIDRGHLFSFECLNVSQSDGPMYSYEYENLRNIRTRKRFLKYVQNCHETPYRTLANGEDATVMVSDKMGNVNYLDETWTIPYNPIERE